MNYNRFNIFFFLFKCLPVYASVFRWISMQFLFQKVTKKKVNIVNKKWFINFITVHCLFANGLCRLFITYLCLKERMICRVCWIHYNVFLVFFFFKLTIICNSILMCKLFFFFTLGWADSYMDWYYHYFIFLTVTTQELAIIWHYILKKKIKPLNFKIIIKSFF